MADQRISYNEYMVGAGHPTKEDTLNRHANVEHNPDGTHKMTAGAAGVLYYHDGTKLVALPAGATTKILVGGGAGAPVWTEATGSGAPVRATSPTLVTPALGTPASGDLRNCSAPTEANKGVTVYAGSVKALAGTDTASAMTPADVAAANAVLAREPDQGVAMTYAASGSSGIQVADNDNIDFGTGNFTLVWKGSLPDWTSASYPRLIEKFDGTNVGFAFVVHEDGRPYAQLYRSGSTVFYPTVTPAWVDGTVHELTAVITRETASVAGSILYYIDGVQLGASVAITAASPVTISNTHAMKVLGSGTTRTAGTTNFAATFNRALTAAEVLSLYRNGIAEADKWGSQTDVNSGWNFSAWIVYFTSTINDANTFSTESEGGGIYKNLGLAVGKKYRVVLAGTLTNCTGISFTGDGGGVAYATGFGTSEFTVGAGGNNFLLLTGVTGTAQVDITTFEIYEIGATLCLQPEGIQPAPGQWLDSSSNKLHAMQPATGSSLVRTKKDFEYRWTNTWTASSAAQYVGGLNQAVLSADHFITDVITQATVTTDVENLTLGDGSDADRFVTAFAPSATRTSQTIAAQNDGTNLKLVYTPAAEATMTVETIIRGFIWEP